MNAMKTLLVAVDLSDVSKPVLEKTAELAQQLSARVVMLHVAEPVATCAPVEATEDLVIPRPPPVDKMEDFSATNSRLKSLEEPLEAVGVDVEIVTHAGLVVVDDIFEQAAKYHADYIILGSHGHGVLYHLFSKSVVTKTLKHAHCPIIVVPLGCETKKY
jgi:nucleotide-binding universal stress UspA family protein